MKGNIQIKTTYPWGEGVLHYESFELVVKNITDKDKTPKEVQRIVAKNQGQYDIIVEEFKFLHENAKEIIDYSTQCFEIIADKPLGSYLVYLIGHLAI